MVSDLHLQISAPSFQDAVTVTRSLGFQYLWLDTLCIIQDDKEDCLKELENMGDIYNNAFVTIAAASAAHSSQGFLLPRSLRKISSVPYCSSRHSHITGKLWFSHDLDRSKLQEDFLATSSL